jgi:hypothetical protein
LVDWSVNLLLFGLESWEIIENDMTRLLDTTRLLVLDLTGNRCGLGCDVPGCDGLRIYNK